MTHANVQMALSQLWACREWIRRGRFEAHRSLEHWHELYQYKNNTEVEAIVKTSSTADTTTIATVNATATATSTWRHVLYRQSQYQFNWLRIHKKITLVEISAFLLKLLMISVRLMLTVDDEVMTFTSIGGVGDDNNNQPAPAFDQLAAVKQTSQQHQFFTSSSTSSWPAAAPDFDQQQHQLLTSRGFTFIATCSSLLCSTFCVLLVIDLWRGRRVFSSTINQFTQLEQTDWFRSVREKEHIVCRVFKE